jgi:hypothetical protein
VAGLTRMRVAFSRQKKGSNTSWTQLYSTYGAYVLVQCMHSIVHSLLVEHRLDQRTNTQRHGGGYVLEYLLLKWTITYDTLVGQV